MPPLHLLTGATMLAVILAARIFTANRVIHRRIALSASLALAYVGLAVVLATGRVPPDFTEDIRSIGRLVLALGVIVFVVTLLINPFREDRVPDRFPSIVQDAIILGLFAIVALVILQERVFATSAVGAVVVGFALQDTLGNAFAGLAIQLEKPYRIGDWIGVTQYEGRVMEVSWRATKLRTRAGNFVVVPNNVISKEAIVNYSEPITHTQLVVEVGTTYDVPPNRVKAVLLDAVRRAPLVMSSPAPDVLFDKFGDSALNFRVRFWIADFANDDLARDQVRTAIYYALARERIEIPYPIQVQFDRTASVDEESRLADVATTLASIRVFAPLSDETRKQLARASQERLFGQGEVMVRQGEPGSSMFVIRTGMVSVTIEPSGQQVATTSAGGYFGELSLLTGEPRTATVTAIGDCTVLEITADMFREVIYPNPQVIEQISEIAVQRRLELERSKAEASTLAGVAQTVAGFLDRVKKFLRLPTW